MYSAIYLAKVEAVRLRSLRDQTIKNIKEHQDLLPQIEKELVSVRKQIDLLDV